MTKSIYPGEMRERLGLNKEQPATRYRAAQARNREMRKIREVLYGWEVVGTREVRHGEGRDEQAPRRVVVSDAAVCESNVYCNSASDAG